MPARLHCLPRAALGRRAALLPLAGGALALALLLPLAGGALATIPPARSPEGRGGTVFLRSPWKADLISYETSIGAGPVTWYLTLSLDPDAGAALARLSFQQSRGADWDFQYSPEHTSAFLGRPRQQGRAVPVRAVFEPEARRLIVEFPEPVAPGETLTVALRPWTNPMVADTYQFQVVVWPAGPRAQASPVGTASLRIYERSRF